MFRGNQNAYGGNTAIQQARLIHFLTVFEASGAIRGVVAVSYLLGVLDNVWIDLE